MKNNNTKSLILTCFSTYVCVYLCRVNFSAALSSLSDKLTLDIDVLGAVGAIFFAIYAVGQLLNGLIGDHINPFKFILTALIGTIICNVGVGLSTKLWQIVLLWGMNGYFQSIFWSTLIRILALKGPKEKQAFMSSTISAAMPAGYFLSWCIVTPLLDNADPCLNFIVPAILTVSMVPVWIKNSIEDKTFYSDGHTDLKKSGKQLFDVIKKDRLPALLIACICHGFIKEGIGFWIPSLIRQMINQPTKVYMMLAILPIANFTGTQVSKKLLKSPRFRSPIGLVKIYFLIMIPLCLLINISSAVGILVLMCVISCCSYAANTVLMSYIPMQYRERNMVSAVVGMLDFFSYMGAAISTYALGSVMSRFGLTIMPWIWLAAVGIAIFMIMHHERSMLR